MPLKIHLEYSFGPTHHIMTYLYLPFAMEKGYVGSYFLWVISGRKWVYIKKPQSTKIETPKQLRLKLADWEKIIKSRCTPEYKRRHGGNLGYKEIAPPLI